MQKLFSAIFLILFSSNIIAEEVKVFAKSHSDLPIVSHKDKLFFFFKTAGKASVPPGSPPQYVNTIYIMTPNNKKIEGEHIIDVTNPKREFQITVEPPIFLGTYTVVIENLSALGATRNFIVPQVLVKNSLNTKRSIISVKSTLPVPANKGDTIQGYFFPFSTFVKEKIQ